MEEKKLNPLQMVAREMEQHSELGDEVLIRQRLVGLLGHLHDRAKSELDRDARSEDALRFSQEYLVAVELINFLGSQLIAFEDIDHTRGVAN